MNDLSDFVFTNNVFIPPNRTKRFVDLSTEQLLAMAAKTDKATPWHKYTRDMLLAFFHNRFGKFVPSAD